MFGIPVQPLPSQELVVSLAGQSCKFRIYQKLSGLYIDVYVSDVLLIGGVICRNLNRIVRSTYLGFVGDLCFVDNQGTDDPSYTGLGSRFSLVYIEASDL